MTAENWCVYLILCADQSLYCGISNRPAERFAAHCNGRAAKYTRIRKPLSMRIISENMDKSAALKREMEIKKMRAANKRDLWAAAAECEVEAV
ncbi:GIY-YIG nuclease family protein [Neisseria perflava]|uniref:GIY-YIG nuclease family protein n=1 Tax=Neisseria perflava TaxID=33053 RepID=UPI00209E0C2B|nr:GIY-YIG nuclease family protein [Neisseria perflava]MCP1661109.1 putative endonuclease [Neisseria perflava]MCP1771470.1 putative endonuclease [Neisseria perflava]